MLTVASGEIRLPALATAHSHAFQRALRGSAQRPGALAGDDFWSWRRAMYALAESLTPESMHAVAGVAFRELRRAGVRTVGEFHYVHHRPGGAPYDDRTVMADAVIDAARGAGLRIALLRVAYHRAGAGRPPEAEQRRFCDPFVDDVLRDVDALRAKWRGDPDVVVGLAAHSVRAVPPAWLAPLAAFAAGHAMPFHMHVAEQPREVAECVAETGRRPVELLAERGVLSGRFVAVHAIARRAPRGSHARRGSGVRVHLPDDRARPRRRPARRRRAASRRGAPLHRRRQPRARRPDRRRASLETNERVRLGARTTFRAPPPATPAEALWAAASVTGAAACGFDGAGGEVVVRRDDPALDLVAADVLLDAIVFGAGASVIARLDASGR